MHVSFLFLLIDDMICFGSVCSDYACQLYSPLFDETATARSQERKYRTVSLTGLLKIRERARA